MSKTICRVSNLSIRYAGQSADAVSDLTLDLLRGERLAIVGESGSGKSTFARALAGLLPEGATCNGRIQWQEDQSPRLGQDLGFVFQDATASLNPLMRIGEQVSEGARRHLGMNRQAACEHARTLLQQVRIPNAVAAMHAYPHQFSGGQRQRITIAAAIASRPSVLIADEVTSALDTVIQAEIIALLDYLVGQHAMTLIFVTHDISLASNLADRIAVFKDGRLVEIGPVADILTRPSGEYTKNLIAGHYDLTTPPLIDRAAAS